MLVELGVNRRDLRMSAVPDRPGAVRVELILTAAQAASVARFDVERARAVELREQAPTYASKRIDEPS